MAERPIGVFLHLGHDELLIEGAAVDPDADRLVSIACNPADRRELFVAAPAGSDISRVDAVFVERFGAGGKSRQQQMTVVVEVADERRGDAGIEHPALDFRDGGRGLRQVHRHAHHLGSRFGELDALLRGRGGIRRIRHSHRLDDNRRTSTDLDGPDTDANCFVETNGADHVVL